VPLRRQRDSECAPSDPANLLSQPGNFKDFRSKATKTSQVMKVNKAITKIHSGAHSIATKARGPSSELCSLEPHENTQETGSTEGPRSAGDHWRHSWHPHHSAPGCWSACNHRHRQRCLVVYHDERNNRNSKTMPRSHLSPLRLTKIHNDWCCKALEKQRPHTQLLRMLSARGTRQSWQGDIRTSLGLSNLSPRDLPQRTLQKYEMMYA